MNSGIQTKLLGKIKNINYETKNIAEFKENTTNEVFGALGFLTEIDLYKKEKIQEIDWIDITNNYVAQKETFKTSKELLRRLHVKDGEKVLQGAEAFLIVWKKIPKYRFLYNFFRLPIIFSLFSAVYELVAFFLYIKNRKQLKN